MRFLAILPLFLICSCAQGSVQKSFSNHDFCNDYVVGEGPSGTVTHIKTVQALGVTIQREFIIEDADGKKLVIDQKCDDGEFAEGELVAIRNFKGTDYGKRNHNRRYGVGSYDSGGLSKAKISHIRR